VDRKAEIPFGERQASRYKGTVRVKLEF
jgi:hypothetical protein